jgi:hypothetical protein
MVLELLEDLEAALHVVVQAVLVERQIVVQVAVAVAVAVAVMVAGITQMVMLELVAQVLLVEF